jgi:hypothetical protein
VTLFPLCFFSLFLDIIKFFIEEKKLLFLKYISRTGMILFKSLEAVISSSEVLEGSVVLRVVNDVLVRKVRDFESWLLK